MGISNIQKIKNQVRRFVKDRDWEKFHSPKNISMSISIEAAELMEHFQWVNTAEEAVEIMKDKRRRAEVEDEIADIAIYLIDFCNLYGIDMESAIRKKLKKNIKKYPTNVV